MCVHKRKMVLIAFFLIIACLFTSCYYFETEQANEYGVFYQEMRKKNDYIYHFLPPVEDAGCIEDIYLFYSDRDLLDTYYTIYVNCKYDDEEYKKEKNRIEKLFVDEDLLIRNSDSFDYESLIYSNLLVSDSFDINMMNYEYVLFSESDSRIIYVSFYDKALNGTSTNIPEEYLPNELVSLRNAK